MFYTGTTGNPFLSLDFHTFCFSLSCWNRAKLNHLVEYAWINGNTKTPNSKSLKETVELNVRIQRNHIRGQLAPALAPRMHYLCSCRVFIVVEGKPCRTEQPGLNEATRNKHIYWDPRCGRLEMKLISGGQGATETPAFKVSWDVTPRPRFTWRSPRLLIIMFNLFNKSKGIKAHFCYFIFTIINLKTE